MVPRIRKTTSSVRGFTANPRYPFVFYHITDYYRKEGPITAKQTTQAATDLWQNHQTSGEELPNLFRAATIDEGDDMKKRTGKDSIRILIVEDSSTQAKMLQRTLEKHDFEVARAANGKEGLNIIKEEKPDIIVSDIVMPQMNGYELCKTVKTDSNFQNIPVILLTTLSEPEDVIRGLESGADSFIIKPYDEDILISRINYTIINEGLRGKNSSEMGIEIAFAGKKHFITSNRIQILDLLISTYENAMQKTRELEKTVVALRKANETIKTLKGLIPICANCKKVRDDAGFWQHIEVFIHKHSGADFTHGICPDCLEKLYPKHSK